MGADGGVVWIPLKKPTSENYTRVLELLNPFWQFLSQDGCSNIGEDTNREWKQENSHIGAPEFLLGYYGTDRGDDFDLFDLPECCDITDDYQGNLHQLTFDELDLDCRTAPITITNSYNHHTLHRLWYAHFGYKSREESLENLGTLASITGEAWASELDSLLHLDRLVSNKTWT